MSGSTPAAMPGRHVAHPGSIARAARAGAGRFWLEVLTRAAHRAPLIPRLARPAALALAWRFSPFLRDGPTVNAARILGPASTPAQRTALARAVVGSFYDFVCEMGRFRASSPEHLRDLVDAVAGEHHYQQARAAASGRGAIIVTAHLGSFELGAAMLRAYEPRVHVVFRRDRLSSFDRMRSEQRQRLGIVEVALDDGWDVWLRLRDALRADEVVMIQGDRVLSGQAGVRVPFLSGTVELPAGPVKLAMATGAPLIPIYSVRSGSGGTSGEGRFRVIIDEPIFVEPGPARWDAPHPALVKLASSLERVVLTHPDQWLMLQRVWCEDRAERNDRGAS